MIIQESRIILSKISTPCLSFLIPFVIINSESDNDYPQYFQTPFSSDLYFLTCKNIKNEQQLNEKAAACIIIPQYNLSEKFESSACKTNSNMCNIREKENQKYVSKYVYKGLGCVDLKERNRKQICMISKKEDTTVRAKYSLLFLKFCFKKNIYK